LDDTYKTGRLLLGNDVIKMMMLMHIIRNFLVSTQMYDATPLLWGEY
jgi:hypothetical protein